MSAAEAPKSEQIQANVAAALSRLRGELGASSSPVAGSIPKAVPKTPTDPAEINQGPSLGPLPAGPVRVSEPERPSNVIRPFEPTLAAATAANPAPMPPPAPPPIPPAPAFTAAATPAPAPALEVHAEPMPKDTPLPGLFTRREPTLSASNDKASAPLTIDADPQPDLLSGVEVPPAPPPPLSALESEDEVSGRGRRMRNRLLLVLVLAVIVGGGGWAYLRAQHTTGPVPVISADTSPEKVKPADEGGMQVPNQNVQILDQSAGQGAEKVMPAPEQPVAPPAVNDAATAEATPAPAEAPAPANDNAPMVTDQPVPSVPAPPVPSASTPEPAVSDVTQPAKPAEPDTSKLQATAPEQPAAEITKPAQTATTAQTQEAAPEAQAATPAKTAEAPKTAQPAAPAAPVATAPSPTTTQTAAAPAAAVPTVQPAAGGKARIQLAAVKSEALAKDQWAKFQKAHPELLGALTLNIQKVQVNGADYYRIQAGPLSDKNSAKDLCSKLKAQNQDCIVAK